MKKTIEPTEESAPVAPSSETAIFHAELIPLNKLVPSPTNPRKKFDAAAMEEMEASMRAHGFTLSTLLVRPWPETYRIDAVSDDQIFVMKKNGEAEAVVEMFGSRTAAEALFAELQGRYEIVAGERRYRAAVKAGIAEAPCIVKELTDLDVIEQQLVENLQRQDLTPMETALGFCALMSMRDAQGKQIHNTKTLHEKTGMSVRYIERHVRLRVIAQDEALKEFLKAFEDGIVGFKHALTVARMPDAALRAKLAKEILHPKYEEAPLSVRRLDQLVQSDYMIDLRDAPFDVKDETLCGRVTDEHGTLKYGGPCKECPMRLGNAPEMFDGPVPSALANMCMNPSCYEGKRDMGWAKWQAAETNEEKKRRATSEKEARQLYPHGNQLAYNCGMVELSDKPDSSVLKAGQQSPGTWRSLVKGTELEVIVTKDRLGKQHELVKLELALQAAETNGHKIFKTQKKEAPQNDDKRREQMMKQNEELRLERELDQAEERAVAVAIHDKALKLKKLPRHFWLELLRNFLDMYEFEEAIVAVEERLKIKNGTLATVLAKLQEEQQIAVIVEMVVLSSTPDQQESLAEVFGVEDKAVRKEARAAAKAAAAQRKKLREQILAAADMAKLKQKDLDKMAEGFSADSFADLADLEALTQILNSIVKEHGSPVDEKLLAKARKLRASGRGKSTGALADELKIDVMTAGRLVDALVDEEHDAKEPKPDPRVSAAKGGIAKAAAKKGAAK